MRQKSTLEKRRRVQIIINNEACKRDGQVAIFFQVQFLERTLIEFVKRLEENGYKKGSLDGK